MRDGDYLEKAHVNSGTGNRVLAGPLRSLLSDTLLPRSRGAEWGGCSHSLMRSADAEWGILAAARPLVVP